MFLFQAHLRFLLILVCIALLPEVMAQKPFKGRIVYSISYPGSTVDLAELQELPDKKVILTKKNMIRAELTGENAGLSQIKIVEPERNEVRTMLEIMGDKYVIVKSFEEIDKTISEMPQPEIEYTSETKEILGYTCKKAIARVTNEFGIEYESEIFYTEEIHGDYFHFDTPYREIPGIMLEYSMRIGPLNIYYQAQSVNKKLIVRNRNFHVTRDYQRVTESELREKLEGGF